MANKGSVLDLSEDNVLDITATGTIKLLAARDIGNESSNLELASDSEVIAASTEKGFIHIHGLGDLLLNTLDSADGDIQVSADGSIKAMNITANDRTDDQDTTVITRSGSYRDRNNLIRWPIDSLCR